MSEETTNIPQDGTVTTPQAQAPALTIIDLSSSRGAFRGAELKTVGEVYEKLDTFLKSVDAEAEKQKADAPATPTAEAETKPAEDK